MASINLLAFLFFSLMLATLVNSATFTIVNNCTYTVWAAAYPSGGQQLNSGQTWSLNVPAGTVGRIWGRTGCTFDSNGNGHCQTGDCAGKLACTTGGTPPDTLAEFALNQFGNQDLYDLSLIDGFNIPMDFGPTTTGCSSIVHCAADVTSQCPNELKTPGGCLHPCQVFKTDEYCCNSGTICEPTTYSMFFKKLCPEAYIYPQDDGTSGYTCPTGTNYQVIFCPSS